jgi:hypothetical protein
MKRQTNVWEEVNEKDMGSRDKTCEKQVTKSTILMHLSFAEFAKSIYMKVNILYRIFFCFLSGSTLWKIESEFTQLLTSHTPRSLQTISCPAPGKKIKLKKKSLNF